MAGLYEFSREGDWGTMGPQVMRRGGATEDGPEFVNDIPSSVMLNGQEWERIGQTNGKLRDYQAHLQDQVKYDPTYGWIIPRDAWEQAQALTEARHGGFDTFLGKFGPALAAGGVFAGPVATNMGLYGGAAAGGAAGSQAGGGSLLDSITNSLSGVSNLSQSELAALIEGGTVGNAGAAMEAAAGIGSGGGLGGLLETLGLGSSAASTIANAASGGGSTAGNALSRLLGLGGSGTDWLSVLGTLGATGLGAYASNKQADALKEIAAQARNDRMPALTAFNSAIANPDTWYQSAPAMGAVDSVLRKLSAQVGNPALNPGALSQAAAYNLGGYNDYLRTTGNLGLSGQDTTIKAQTNAALGDSNFYNALGAGLQQLTQPRNTLYDSLGKYLLP